MLNINNLNFSYENSRLILENFSLTVNEGELICIEGNNGAGKTTLLNIISGIIYVPDLMFKFYDETISQQNLRNQVIYIPTEPVFYENLTVLEYIAFVKYLWKQSNNFESEVLKNINMLNLKYEDKQVIQDFSLGMKYKLYLSTFLAIKRKILLLDEPLNSLDRESRETAIELIKAYVKNNSSCCIFSSHVGDTIDKLSSRTVVLNR